MITPNEKWKRCLLFLTVIAAGNIGLALVDTAYGLIVCGVTLALAVYVFAFRNRVYLWSHLTILTLFGSAIFLLGGPTDSGLLNLKTLPDLGGLKHESWEIWACLGSITLTAAFHQFYFFMRSIQHNNSDVKFLAVVLLSSTNFGLMVAIRLLYPLTLAIRPQLLDLINIVAIGGLFFFALLSLFSDRPRQLLINLIVIQSSFVLLGFIQMNALGSAGAVVQWVVAILAGAGFGLCISIFESRVGIGDFSSSSVPIGKMPRLAFMYFFFGMAMVDFPGTLGFIGEDLLVHGIMGKSAISGFIILLTMAFASIAIYKSFTELFLGKKMAPNEFKVDLVRSEVLSLAILMIALVAFSFVPGAFTAGVYGTGTATGKQISASKIVARSDKIHNQP